MKNFIAKSLANSTFGRKQLMRYESIKNIGYPFRPYMDKSSVLFIHIPKCAGTSVLKMLGDEAEYRTHVPAYIYKEANKHKYENYVKFSIIRNPWDRLYSTYTYLSSGGNQKSDLEDYKEVRGISFESFVMCWLSEDRVASVKLFQSQCFYIRDPISGDFLVDIVGKLEDVSDAIKKLNDACGKEWALPHLNKSKSHGYREQYSEAMKNKVDSLYKTDCENLGYEF